MKFPVKDGKTTLLVDVEMVREGNKLAVSFPYCPPLVDEFRNMGGARWQGFDKKNPRKVWLIDDSGRNRFRMDYMRWLGTKDCKPVLGDRDPYARYSAPLIKVDCAPRRYRGEVTPYYGHQPEGVSFVVTRRQCILAWDMGTGKTLVIGTAMEWAKAQHGWTDEDFWFVCKNGALYEVKLGFEEWDIGVRPRFMSYETMKSVVEAWPKGKPAPKFIVFDESTQIKGPASQRSVAALHLADSARAEWGEDAFVVCMTGTPSPNNPPDWWMQAEVACPGFIREGEYNKFKARLCILELQEKEEGGKYKSIKKDSKGNKVWYDDERKCKVCGELNDHVIHGHDARLNGRGHPWEKSINEVLLIDKRLRGFVSKKFKKDCMDLPERVYTVVRCRPTQQLLNAARLAAKAARGAADALNKLRQLSDGFQYQDNVVAWTKCAMCQGNGMMLAKEDPDNPGLPPSDEALRLGRLVDYEKSCDECAGVGETSVEARVAARVPCPKDEVLEGLLEEHDDVGRLPIYAGFTDSVDRVVDVCLRNKWKVIRVDARGWIGFVPDGEAPLPRTGPELYNVFRFGQAEHAKVAFVAQASTAAHGLNFDCAPTIVNFSRDFNFENAMQGDERNMRGRIMETLKKSGRTKVTVVDIVHLPSDQVVLDNHKRKRKLQALTLGEVEAAMSEEPR